MPILLKKVEARIISLFSNSSSNFTAPIYFIKNTVGTAGIEDYIMLTNFEAFTQDFSKVIEANFITSPTTYGLGTCSTYVDLTISY
jgi:hypothetical protein